MLKQKGYVHQASRVRLKSTLSTDANQGYAAILSSAPLSLHIMSRGLGKEYPKYLSIFLVQGGEATAFFFVFLMLMGILPCKVFLFLIPFALSLSVSCVIRVIWWCKLYISLYYFPVTSRKPAFIFMLTSPVALIAKLYLLGKYGLMYRNLLANIQEKSIIVNFDIVILSTNSYVAKSDLFVLDFASLLFCLLYEIFHLYMFWGKDDGIHIRLETVLPGMDNIVGYASLLVLSMISRSNSTRFFTHLFQIAPWLFLALVIVRAMSSSICYADFSHFKFSTGSSLEENDIIAFFEVFIPFLISVGAIFVVVYQFYKFQLALAILALIVTVERIFGGLLNAAHIFSVRDCYTPSGTRFVDSNSATSGKLVDTFDW